jgi:multiple sugar transport system permease protein
MKPLSLPARLVVYALLVGGSVIFLFPLLWMFSTSLKTNEQTLTMPPQWIPTTTWATIDGQPTEVLVSERISPEQVEVVIRSGPRLHVKTILPESSLHTRVQPRWENYPKALASLGGTSPEQQTFSKHPDNNVPVWVFLCNTLIVCILGVVGSVLSNALVAYGLARIRWRGRKLLFALTMATMMVPFPVLMVPLYAVFRQLGWVGTLYPLWVPAFFGGAFNIFLIRQFFRTIPEELSEAARIDGCSEWQIFWQIILPLSRPVLAVVALFHFLAAWNDFMGPLLYLTRRHTFTLALALQSYQTQLTGVQWHFLMAASVTVVLPILLLFFFTQKTFIRGIATGGIKG